MSSNFCSRPIDWSKYGVVYAGAQKNLGPAGLCVTIVREDLIGSELPGTPTMCSWKTFSKATGQHQNTPCTWAIYVAGLNISHMLNFGLDKLEADAAKRSNTLYDYIENSGGYYSNPVDPAYRSRMNVPFRVNKGKIPNSIFYVLTFI